MMKSLTDPLLVAVATQRVSERQRLKIVDGIYSRDVVAPFLLCLTGVTVFDKDSGLWLVHSVPKFPPATDKNYSYPSSADIYGQHFLCVSLRSSADVTLIGKTHD